MSIKVKNIFIKYNLYDSNIAKYKKIDLCREIYKKDKRYTMSTLLSFNIDVLDAMLNYIVSDTLHR